MPVAETTVYTSPANTNTIIDKFTVVNKTASTRTWSLYIVPYGETFGPSNLIVDTASWTAHFANEVLYLQNQILNIADSIVVISSDADSLTMRCSGRQVS